MERWSLRHQPNCFCINCKQILQPLSFFSLLKIPYTGDGIQPYICSMSTLLNEAISHGILDLAVIERQVNAMKRQEYLDKHKNKLYQNKDGRWVTYLPGRKRIQRGDKESLNDAIVEYYRKAEDNPTVGDIFNEWNQRRLDLGRIKASLPTVQGDERRAGEFD